MGIGTSGEDFLKITCRGFNNFILGVWEKLFDLLFLRRAKRCCDGDGRFVQICPISEFVSIFLQRQRYSRQ